MERCGARGGGTRCGARVGGTRGMGVQGHGADLTPTQWYGSGPPSHCIPHCIPTVAVLGLTVAVLGLTVALLWLYWDSLWPYCGPTVATLAILDSMVATLAILDSMVATLDSLVVDTGLPGGG